MVLNLLRISSPITWCSLVVCLSHIIPVFSFFLSALKLNTLTPMRRGRGGLRATGERGADTCLGGQPDAGPGIGPRRFTHVAAFRPGDITASTRGLRSLTSCCADSGP